VCVPVRHCHVFYLYSLLYRYCHVVYTSWATLNFQLTDWWLIAEIHHALVIHFLVIKLLWHRVIELRRGLTFVLFARAVLPWLLNLNHHTSFDRVTIRNHIFVAQNLSYRPSISKRSRRPPSSLDHDGVRYNANATRLVSNMFNMSKTPQSAPSNDETDSFHTQ